jgi:hypothetical protein
LFNKLMLTLFSQCHPHSPPSMESPLASPPTVRSVGQAKVLCRAETRNVI